MLIYLISARTGIRQLQSVKGSSRRTFVSLTVLRGRRVHTERRQGAKMATISGVLTSRCRIFSCSSSTAFELSWTIFYHGISVYDETYLYNNTNILALSNSSITVGRDARTIYFINRSIETVNQ